MRLLHGGVAVAFGAADALVTAKVTKPGPGGIPFPVYLEGAGVLAGMFGGKVGINEDIRTPLLLSSLALAGARLTRAATKGSLMAGPKAWGGDFTDASSSAGGDAHGGGAPAALAGRPAIRQLGPARGGYLGPTLYSGQSEPAGVAG